MQAAISDGEAEIAEHQKAIEEKRERINDARVTLRTLQSMGVDASAYQPKAEPPPGAETMTVPEMVLAVLKDAEGGMEPSDVLRAITVQLGLKPDPNNVRPTMWRMKKKGRLYQDKDGKYRLPKEKPVGVSSTDVSPTGFNFNPQHGREAGQGGGT